MEEGTKDPRTVFIKGVSFDWDNAEFEKAFSDVGPVRKCFLLKGAGKNHKGCGFVTFALPEDADRAIQEFNGKKLGGRTVQVEAAQRRAPFAERKEKKRKRTEEGDAPAPAADPSPAPAAAAKKPAAGKAAAAARRPQPAAAAPPEAAAAGGGGSPASGRPAKRRRREVSDVAREKQRLVRTVALGNLTPGIRAAAVAYAQSVGEVEAVWEPSQAEQERLRLQRDGCAGDVAFLAYRTVKDALAGVAALHNHVLQPPEAEGGRTGGKKPEQAAAKAGTALWARQAAGEGAHLKKWRLIVRNLPFDVQEGRLRELLSPAGFVWELTVLRNPDGKARGFAFAGFMCYAHAERAIKLANGKVVGGRTVAVDWAVPKAQFTANGAEEATGEAAEGAAAEQEAAAGSGSAQEGSSDEEEAGVAGLVPAGEAADSAANLEQERALLKSVLAELEGEDHEAPQQAAAGEQAGKAQKGAGTAPAAVDGRKQQPVKPGGSPTGQGAGAGTAEGMLERSERHAGPGQVHRAEAASAARPAGAPSEAAPGAAGVSGRVEATVFVRGLPLDILQFEVQERLARFGKLAACRLVMDKGTRKLKGTAFVEFEQQESAEKAVAACAKARHVFLAGQGPQVLVRGVPVEVDLALSQQDVRSLAADRGAKAPSTRDSRNLYLLREGLIEEGSAAWEAMSAADRAKRKRAAAEGRTKLQSPNFFLSRTRLCLRNLPAAMTEKALKELVLAAVRERAAKAQPRVHQVKILRDAGEGPKSGKGKGFAFVELTEHEHALCALRQLNNNPVPFGKDRRPIVEFAIENAQTLKKRGMRGPPQRKPAADGAAAQQADAPQPSAPQQAQRGSGQAGAAPAAADQAANGGRTEAPASRKQLGKRKRAERAASRQAVRASAAGGAPDVASPSGQDAAPGSQGRAAKRAKRAQPGGGAAGTPSSSTQAPGRAQQPGPGQRAGRREAADGGVTASDGKNRQSKRARQSSGSGASEPGAAGKGGKPKRRKTEAERADKLDSLVAQYRTQLFGDARGKAGGKAGARSSMQRWFE